MAHEDKFHFVAVTGAIVKDGKFLITKRSLKEKVFPGKWGLPGGRLERSDYVNNKNITKGGQWYNILETLLSREVKEETGLDIKNIRYLTNLTFIRPDDIPVVVISMFAEHAGGEVVLNHESADHKWITAEEAKSMDMIDGIYEELVEIERILKK